MDAPLRSSLARATLAAALGAVGLGLLVRSWAAPGGDYLARHLVIVGLAMLVIVSRVGRHHPFDRLGAANHATLARLILVAAVAALIGEPRSVPAAWVAVGATAISGALDGVDGWLARRSGMTSAFGARFDMETDALLILALSVLVWQHGKAGPWVLACGAMRYAFVAAGWWLPWMAGPLRSTLRGKTVAVAQLVGLGIALTPLVPPPYSTMVAAVTLAALTWSFAVDVAWLRRIAA